MNHDLSELIEHASEVGYAIPCIKDDGSVDLLAKSYCGDTLLHVAVGQEKPDAVKYLVNAGLDINARGDFFETPLYKASVSGQVIMIELLLKLGADPNIPNHLGELPSEAHFRKRN